MSLLSLPNDVIRLVLAHVSNVKSSEGSLLIPVRCSCKRLCNLIPRPARRALFLVNTAAEHGFLDLLKWALARGFASNRVRDDAVKAGQVEVLLFLHAQGKASNVDVARAAAYAGNLDLIRKRYLRHRLTVDESASVAVAAADANQLAILKWLHAQKAPLTPSCYDGAAHNGNFAMLEFLRDACLMKETACAAAARHGQFEVLKWLRSQGCPWDFYTTRAAVKAKRDDILQFALSHGCRSYPDYAALCRGPPNVATVSLFYDAGIDDYNLSDTPAFPVEIVNLEAFRYLSYENERVWKKAAGCGQLEVLKWIQHNWKLRYPESVYAAAAQFGRFNVLKWALESGIPRSGYIYGGAAHAGSIEILDWALENGFPLSEEPAILLYANALEMHHLHVVEWAKKHSIPLPKPPGKYYWKKTEAVKMYSAYVHYLSPGDARSEMDPK